MYYQIKGLVLNASLHGEFDKVITLYSYEWGKISAVVPSAKKITAKLASATEPLTESEFMIFQSHPSMRPKVTGASILNNNTKLKSDFERNIYALYASEVSDKFLPFNMENAEKYILISRIWDVLGYTHHPKRALTAFILRLLKLSGYSFSDYLKSDYSALDKDTVKIINKLSKCSADNLDAFDDTDDDKIWNYVESYLTNYIKKPQVSVFLKKIGY